jgi:hypothetical protein
MVESDYENIKQVKRFLARHRNHYNAYCALNGFLFIGIITFCMLSAVQLTFQLFPWIALIFLWDVIVFFSIIFTAILIINCFFIRNPPLLFIAGELEKSSVLVPRWFSLALELSDDNAIGSIDLKKEVVRQAVVSMTCCKKKIQQHISKVRILLFVVSLVLWTMSVFFSHPSCYSYWDMGLTINKKIQARIVPGDIIVPERTSVTIQCIPEKKQYPSCRVLVNGLNSNISKILKPDSTNRFSLKLDSLQSSISYRFSIGGYSFPADSITVAKPPVIYSIHIKIIPPSYTRSLTQTLQEGQGNFRAYTGSRAVFSITGSTRLKQANFSSSTGDKAAFTVHNNEASGEVIIRQSCGYTISLIDTFGQHSDSINPFFIECIPDINPQVNILRPGINKILSTSLSETLWVEAIDDIGISRMSLNWRKNTESKDSVHVINLLRQYQNNAYIINRMSWYIGNMSLYPGDTVYYWAYARDNCPYDTSHYGITPVYWLRVPGFEEIHDNLVTDQNSMDRAVASAKNKQETLRNEIANLMRSARGKESLSWEQKKILEDIHNGFKSQSDTLDKAVTALKNTVKKMREQGISNSDILDKMDKVKQALEEISREYGDSIFFEKMKKNDSPNIEDLRNALDKLKKMIPDLASRLEQTLKYLESLKRDLKIAELAGQAEKYGKEHVEMAEKIHKAEQKKKTADLKECTDRLLSEISANADSSGNGLFSRADVPSLDRALMHQKSMPDPVDENMPNGRDAMSQIGADLMSLAQEMRDLESSAMMEKHKRDMETIMEMSRDAINMSSWQKEISSSVQGAHLKAQSQQALKQALLNSSGKIDRMSTIPPLTARRLMKQYQNLSSEMDNSINDLKNDKSASSGMFFSGEGLDMLAFSLLDMAGSMENNGQAGAGGSGGECSGEEMMAGFRRLSGKQSMINSATGELLRQMLEGNNGESGGSYSQQSGKVQKARKEAGAAQQAIADELKKLSEKYGKMAGNGLDEKAKDLEQEARRLANMLENPTEDIPDRQQKFLSRMLQATISIHKQDEDRENRQSKSAETVFSFEEVTTDQQIYDKDSFFKMRQKAFSGNYPESYRFSIKNYFDSLCVLFLKAK